MIEQTALRPDRELATSRESDQGARDLARRRGIALAREKQCAVGRPIHRTRARPRPEHLPARAPGAGRRGVRLVRSRDEAIFSGGRRAHAGAALAPAQPLQRSRAAGAGSDRSSLRRDHARSSDRGPRAHHCRGGVPIGTHASAQYADRQPLSGPHQRDGSVHRRLRRSPHIRARSPVQDAALG